MVYSPEPRAEVYCLKLNINISKLGYLAAYIDNNDIQEREERAYDPQKYLQHPFCPWMTNVYSLVLQSSVFFEFYLFLFYFVPHLSVLFILYTIFGCARQNYFCLLTFFNILDRLYL